MLAPSADESRHQGADQDEDEDQEDEEEQGPLSDARAKALGQVKRDQIAAQFF